ncbi:MAG TPA: hypothetical protein VK524_01735 [Polyangiaceae bacterium]|nr:hypothetical protein [Polyangiaceae bacterium]
MLEMVSAGFGNGALAKLDHCGRTSRYIANYPSNVALPGSKFLIARPEAAAL